MNYKAITIGLVVGLIPLFIYWLGGGNFERGHTLALASMIGISAGVWAFLAIHFKLFS